MLRFSTRTASLNCRLAATSHVNASTAFSKAQSSSLLSLMTLQAQIVHQARFCAIPTSFNKNSSTTPTAVPPGATAVPNTSPLEDIERNISKQKVRDRALKLVKDINGLEGQFKYGPGCSEMQQEAVVLFGELCDGELDPMGVAASLNNVGLALTNIKELEVGTDIRNIALELYAQLLAGKSYDNLGLLLQKVGDALERVEEASSGEKRQWLFETIDDEALARSLERVGSLLERAGEPEKGVALKLESLEMNRRIFKESHELAASLNNTAVSLENLGHLQAGISLKMQALDMRRKLFEEKDHEDLARAINNLGVSLTRDPTKRNEGIALMIEAYEMRKRIFKNDDSIDLFESLNNIGYTLFKDGERREDGLQMMMEALRMMRRLVKSGQQGGTQEDLARALNNAGFSLEQCGQRDEGIRLQLEALEVLRKVFGGRDHRMLASSLDNCGVSLVAINRKEEGFALLQEGLAMLRRLFNDGDHEVIARSMNNVGACMEGLKREAEGIALKKEAVAMLRRLTGGQDDMTLATHLLHLGKSVGAKNPEDGKALETEAEEMRARILARQQKQENEAAAASTAADEKK